MANLANALLPCILTWKATLPIFVGLIASYYFFSISRKPLIVTSNGKLKKFLNNHINTLRRPFYPTPWAINSHLQTIFRAILEKSPEIDSQR